MKTKLLTKKHAVSSLIQFSAVLWWATVKNAPSPFIRWWEKIDCADNLIACLRRVVHFVKSRGLHSARPYASRVECAAQIRKWSACSHHLKCTAIFSSRCPPPTHPPVIQTVITGSHSSPTHPPRQQAQTPRRRRQHESTQTPEVPNGEKKKNHAAGYMWTLAISPQKRLVLHRARRGDGMARTWCCSVMSVTWRLIAAYYVTSLLCARLYNARLFVIAGV